MRLESEEGDAILYRCVVRGVKASRRDEIFQWTNSTGDVNQRAPRGGFHRWNDVAE
jgi:hypothetical protein